MNLLDRLQFSSQALSRNRFKSAMVLLSITIAVTAVVLLASVGEGAKRYVFEQFSFLGSDVVVMFPGRNETTGGLPPVTGAAARDITLEEAYALQQRLSSVKAVAPLVVGSADVSFGTRARQVIVLGTTKSFIDIRQLPLALGQSLPEDDWRRAGSGCLLGETLRRALFDQQPVIGQLVRVQGYRCRVLGVLGGRGDAFGMDLSDSLVIPVASAQQIFNIHGLLRVVIQFKPGFEPTRAKQHILALMQDFHQGELDVTLVSPDALLASFGQILNAMTLAVVAIASISLVVAGLLIMNITLISVSQRTQEIGLLKALGASSSLVLSLFLQESLLLAVIASSLGLGLSIGVMLFANSWQSYVALSAPLWAVTLAVGVALLVSLVFAWLPARRAASMAPVLALSDRG